MNTILESAFGWSTEEMLNSVCKSGQCRSTHSRQSIRLSSSFRSGSMKQLVAATILALSLLASTTVGAEEKAGAQEAAVRLMDAMGMETALAKSIDASLDTQLKNNPELGP